MYKIQTTNHTRIIVLLACLFTTDCYSQTKYFLTDTVGQRVDSITKDITYFIIETWYLSDIDSINNALIFDKDHSKHTMKFEFAQSGLIYVEAGWLTCGKYGMDFELDYKLDENIITVPNPDNIFSEILKGEFIISKYTTKKMVLKRKH